MARLREEDVLRYQRGETSREVAACCVSKATVLRILRQSGIEVRPQGVRYFRALFDIITPCVRQNLSTE
jgi:hypothetical protein